MSEEQRTASEKRKTIQEKITGFSPKKKPSKKNITIDFNERDYAQLIEAAKKVDMRPRELIKLVIKKAVKEVLE